MKNVLALAVMAGACSGGASSPTSPTGVTAPASFTLTRLIVGIPDGGTTETGTPVNGGTGEAYTIIFVTKLGDKVVDSQSFSRTETVSDETFYVGAFRPTTSGTYTVEVSIKSAPAPVSATFTAF